ncbi:MAG: hypothetical protein LUM44_15920 [Pyrinomonadaceae bacterium]|nr:hypothetical protein [Pyrinomonadaceae bacterium]
MDKTYRTELRRTFLLRGLPEPLKKSSRHLQIFDNYLENTRLRLRRMRSPDTKEWNFILQQIFPVKEKKGLWKIAEIYLNEAEHDAFKIFESREIRRNERIESNEIRKNRYFFESDKKVIEIDVFLGELWGLHIAKAVFESEKELEDFEIPPFAIAEITGNSVFDGENLVGNKFIDIQVQLQRMKEEN